MAEVNPLFLSSGSIRQMTSSLNTVVNYIHLPVTQSGSSAIFTTNLPDPYLFASLSANITNNSNTTNQPIYQYNIPNRQENYFYTSNAIIGVSTTNTTSGVRIGLLRSQLANTAFIIKSPTTLTGFTFANVTTQANTTYVLPGSHPAPGNTIYPTHFKGFTSNILTSNTSSILNTYVVQPEANVVVSASAGSVFYNQFIGYSSSLTPTSSIPFYFYSGSLKPMETNDTISTSFLSPTSSLWLSQSLATSVVSADTNYTTVFTLTGLTTGQRYLVNLYMIGSSSTSVHPFRVRVVTGSQYNGTLWVPQTTTSPFIQNSVNGDNITVGNPTQWPASNTGYLIYGEYTFVKGETDPQVQITANTTLYFIAALTGSVIFYRPIS
jgi:hypothetical protein